MKQDFKITVRLIVSIIALLVLLRLLQNRSEEVPAVSQDTAVDRKHDISYEREPSCQLTDLDPAREVRVLLTNPAGGYFFETAELNLKDVTYRFDKKDIRKRGIVRIQAGDENIRFLQKESGNNPALYPGDFILHGAEQGIWVVNSLPLEEYLKLVVPGEMPAGYPEEALKSQAVLARTFAVRCMLSPALPEYDADLDDTTGFQVYAGTGGYESTTRAVADTAGSILCVGDTVADVHYFSTSCGQTTTTQAWNCPGTEGQELSAEAAQRRIDTEAQFPEMQPRERSVHVGTGKAQYTAEELQHEAVFEAYINSVDDGDYERDVPWYRWEYQAELDPAKLYGRIRERYGEYPSQVLSRPSGETYFSEDALIDPGTIRDIRVTGRSPGGCASELTITGTEGEIRIRTEYSIRYVLCDTVSEAVLQDGSTHQMGTILPSAFFAIKTGKDKQDVIGYTLVGGGFGHGIGMTQNGASAMAKEGYDYRQIIAFFYPEYRLINLQRID